MIVMSPTQVMHHVNIMIVITQVMVNKIVITQVTE